MLPCARAPAGLTARRRPAGALIYGTRGK